MEAKLLEAMRGAIAGKVATILTNCWVPQETSCEAVYLDGKVNGHKEIGWHRRSVDRRLARVSVKKMMQKIAESTNAV